MQSETRKVYCTLLETDLIEGDEDDNSFSGFDIGPHAVCYKFAGISK